MQDTFHVGRGGSFNRIVLAIGASIVGLAPAAFADVEPDAAMLRNPAISESKIAFVYANQVWTAPRTGGQASPLAAPYGRAGFPRFSPDGKSIAFVGNYDGNRDIYSMPLTGGVPTRVTHHPAGETLCGWTADGKLLFFAGGVKGDHWTSKLFTVAPGGGLPEQLPVPYGTFGAVSPNGEWLAYTPWSRDNATWKRYVGGTAADIWLFNLKNRQSKRITDWEGSDLQPMWGYNRASKIVYYLSDAGPEHRWNIWAYDTDSNQREQVTKFADDDVKWPSIGPGPGEERGKGEIVFSLGSKLMVLNLDSKQSNAVRITIPGARPRLRSQIKDAAGQTSYAAISPSGKRALFTARGEIFSVPVKEGVARNLTNTGGVHERFATWSPDGRWIAYFSDKSGEYELYIQASDARTPDEEPKDDDKAEEAKKDDKDEKEKTPAKPRPREAVKLTSLGAGFRFAPWWLPDSKHLVFTDNAGSFMIAALNTDGETPTAEVKTIDTDPWSQQQPLSYTQDSGWVAYIRADEGTGNGCVWIYNVKTAEKTRVTTPMFGATDVAFDRKGDYLYFRQRCEVSKPTYGDFDGAFVYAGTERMLLVPLRQDVKNPLAPKSEEEALKDEAKEDDSKKDGDKKDDEKKNGDKKEGDAAGADGKKPDDAKGDDKKDKKKSDKKKPKPVKIDFEGFEQRAVRLPLDAGNFGSTIVADGGKLLYIRRGPQGSDTKPSLKIFDVAADEKEEKEVVADCGDFILSDDGKKILARVGGKWKTMDPAPDGGGKDKKKDVSTDGLKVQIDPREEWRNIFNDAWRIMRDYFYVENMHGVDWAKAREHYGKMIEDCANREDVNFVISELISELNVGHAYLWGQGDIEDAPTMAVGLLGCDYELIDANGAKAYRISAIYQGAPWDTDARAPIAGATAAKHRPKVGDFLLAVNGRPVDTKEDPWAAFVGLADKPTMITVSDKPTLDDTAREVLVKPVSGDRNLRYRAWIERKRAYVAEKTGGKVAYLHVPNTGIDGQNELFRQFFGQTDRAAMIIDERWNGGGQIPWRFIELLNRPRTNYWAVRHGKDWPWPQESHQGPKCMLINEQAGSGGDMFPWLFRHHKIGKLIGMRTWGGLVGISGNPELIDGGAITAPTFGFYKTDGTWGIEGHGVDPDMKVIDDPALMAEGGDPQLDAAIALMLEEIQKNPAPTTKRPDAPNRSGMGIPERDR